MDLCDFVDADSQAIKHFQVKRDKSQLCLFRIQNWVINMTGMNKRLLSEGLS